MKAVMLVPEKRPEDGYGQTCSLCDRPIVKRPLEPPPLRVEGGWQDGGFRFGWHSVNSYGAEFMRCMVGLGFDFGSYAIAGPNNYGGPGGSAKATDRTHELQVP